MFVSMPRNLHYLLFNLRLDGVLVLEEHEEPTELIAAQKRMEQDGLAFLKAASSEIVNKYAK